MVVGFHIYRHAKTLKTGRNAGKGLKRSKTMSKLISVDRVKEIIQETCNAEYEPDYNNETPDDYDIYLGSWGEESALLNAIDAEPAQEFFCSQCGKQIPTNICSDCWYGQRECKRCKELEQQLTDYLHTSSHKIKDKRIRELEDKIKELEGLLREVLEIFEIDEECTFSADTYKELQRQFINKIKQALEGK
jgi:hypothetical protein